MNELQTKPLIPEWVTKLVEALDDEYLITYDLHNGDKLTREELAVFIWTEWQRLQELNETVDK